jgi:hypothetical protein
MWEGRGQKRRRSENQKRRKLEISYLLIVAGYWYWLLQKKDYAGWRRPEK